MTVPSQLTPLTVKPGVQPSTDLTALATPHWVASKAIRFWRGIAQKIGGWRNFLFQSGQAVSGIARTLYSAFINNTATTVIGTNSNVYALYGQMLTNITPLQTTTTAIPNSLNTIYDTLPANPVSTTSGSMTVSIQGTPNIQLQQVGDSITLSGLTATGGITAANLNGIRIIRSINSSNQFTVVAGTAATSTTTGGGSSGVLSSGLIGVTETAHGLSNGQRINIKNAAIYTANGYTVANPGTGAQRSDVLTLQGGTGTAATATVATTKSVSATVAFPGTSPTVYAPGNVLTVQGGTGTASTFNVATTKVTGANIVANGSGGTNGTQIVTGTTGTGVKAQITVTISGGAISGIVNVALAGSYTVNPTNPANEPVTGAGLSGAALSFVMGVETVTVGTAGSYTSNPVNPVSTTNSGSGTGATLTVVYGVNSVTLGNAGMYITPPSNPVSTTSNGTEQGVTLNATYNGSGNVGGISNTLVNGEFIIRDVTTNKFYVSTTGYSTSATTADGGTYTTTQSQIGAGNVNQSLGLGYGLGLYGAGLYGVSKTSVSGITYPRIWYMDRFGDRIVMTPGNQGSIYLWDGSVNNAPSLLANAPTAVNYAFVSDNILVTFGYQNVSNQIFASDQGNATQWTASSTNQVYQDVIEGADRFISHVPVLGVNLLFTPFQTYRFSYIGLPLVWEVKLLDNSIGIIAPMARCSVNNVAYWMADNNFYMWAGGNVEVIPSNSMDQSTMLAYVFNNINRAQASKCFAWYNKQFNEVWFHYPSAASNECDSIARVSIIDKVWSPDVMDRTCAEYPQNLFENPRLMSSSSFLYNHETGTDDDVNPLPFSLTSNFRVAGKNTGLTTGFIPDSIQTGTIQVTLTSQLFPQSSDMMYSKTFDVTETMVGQSGKIDTQISGRLWQYTISGNVLGQDWIMGQWSEFLQKAGGQ